MQGLFCLSGGTEGSKLGPDSSDVITTVPL